MVVVAGNSQERATISPTIGAVSAAREMLRRLSMTLGRLDDSCLLVGGGDFGLHVGVLEGLVFE